MMISLEWVVRSTTVGFSGTADRMVLLPAASNPIWPPAAILEISNVDFSVGLSIGDLMDFDGSIFHKVG